ncbi:MAG: hypothetical protein IT350_09145 [Deltaproteobacteria bacterium]|nr:hypothetical protein [Deltaproteobacteria bacterium]
MSGAKAERFHEIDLLKGLACYLMLTGHALRAHPAGFGPLGFVDKIIIYAMDFSGPVFFVASGMNVCTFFDRNRAKAGFDAFRFYLGQAAILFVLGYTYSLAIGSLAIGIPDIFQGVAVCTSAVFLVMYLRLPGWAYLVVAAAVYAVYWPFRLELDAITAVANTVPMWTSIETYDQPMFQTAVATVKSLPLWKRQLFAHFSFFPWAVFFLIGAAVFRTRGRVGEILTSLVFLAMLGASTLLPQAFFSNPVELFFRGVPGYVLQTGGGAGLAFIVGRHLYRGAGGSRIARAIEFAGQESFLLLILHFFLITVSLMFLPKLHMYARAVLIIAGTAWLLPILARRRDRWALGPAFERNALVVLGVTFAVGIFLSAAPPLYILARLVGFVSAFAFAFVFGSIRTRWRAKCLTPNAA